VLYRVEQRAVTRIRMFSEGCYRCRRAARDVDHRHRRAPERDTALAFHDGRHPATRVADGALASLHARGPVGDDDPGGGEGGGTATSTGRRLLVASAAGERAAPAIAEAIERDPETDVKKRAVFALSQLPDGEGVPRLIEVAEHHSNAAVRRQAMFWLGQSKDPRALAFFERILLR
jgi:hypothetical protein